MRALPLLLVLLLAADEEEPRFRGRTAAEWARLLEQTKYDAYDIHVKALASGGETSLAVLVRMLESDAEIACWSLAPLIEMGTKAAPAVPALIRALGNDELGMDVVDVLVELGPSAVPGVCGALGSKSEVVRLHATFVLANNPPGRPVVAGLTRALADRSADVRKAAAEGLVRMESEEAATLRALAKALRDGRLETREHAAGAIEGGGVAAGLVLDDLLAAFEDGADDVRGSAGRAIRSLAEGGPGGRVSLERIRSLLASDRPDAPLVALELALACGPAARELVPAILPGLRAGDEEVRNASAYGLGQIGHASPDVVEALLAAMETGPPRTRGVAAAALASLAADGVLPRLRTRLAKEQSPAARLVILEAILSLEPGGGEEAEAIAADLGRLVETADPPTAWRALLSLEPPASRAAIPALIRALARDDETIRRRAADCLAELGPLAAPARDALQRLAGDADLRVRSAAGLALARIEDRPAAVAARLRTMLEGVDDPFGRILFLEQIHALTPDAEFVGPRMLEIVQQEPVYTWSLSDLIALDSVRDVAIPRILASMADTAVGPDEDLSSDVYSIGERCADRGFAATGIRHLGESAVPALVGPLRKARAVSVRWRVALALGEMEAKPASAVPALVEAMRDSKEDLRVRWAAAMSLAKIARAPGVAIPALVATLAEKDLRLRWYAIDALGAYGKAAAPAIEKLDPFAKHPELGPAARAARDAIRPK